MSKVGEYFRDNDQEWIEAMDFACDQAEIIIQCLMTIWGIKYDSIR